MPSLPAQQQLQLLSRFCQEQGIPFPSISPSPEEQRQPQECHMFCDPAQPEAPAVLHFPLVNDSFQDHSAPGEPWSLLFQPRLSAGDPKPSAQTVLFPQGCHGRRRRRQLGR